MLSKITTLSRSLRSLALALLAALLLAVPVEARDVSFDYSLELAGDPYNPIVNCLMGVHGPDLGAPGAQGWCVAIAITGDCQIESAVVGAAVHQLGSPPDFEFTEVTHGIGNEGVFSCVIPGFTEYVTLPVSTEDHEILRLRVVPTEGASQPCRLSFQDGLQGKGDPVVNAVTHEGTIGLLALGDDLEFAMHDCFAEEDTGPWTPSTLDPDVRLQARPRVDGVEGYEMCSDAAGYGPASDLVSLLSEEIVEERGRPLNFERTIRLDQVSAGGMGGIELRADWRNARESARLRISVEQNASGQFTLISAFRPTAGSEEIVISPQVVALPIELRITKEDETFTTSYSFHGEFVTHASISSTAKFPLEGGEGGFLASEYLLSMAQSSLTGKPTQARFAVIEEDSESSHTQYTERMTAESGVGPGSDPAAGGWQLPGDATQDGRLDVSDALRLVNALFGQTSAGFPCAAGAPGDEANRTLFDSNGDGGVDLTDGVALFSYLFLSGASPAGGTECIRVPGCPSACAE